MTGLYIHIPFCVKKCHYCNFVITPLASGAKEEHFLKLFEKEALHRAPALAGRKFDTLYFGGGTPSTLTEAQLEKVFSILSKNFSFHSHAEVTLEANPADISPAKARFLKKAGVNRVSLGAQSFHDKTLKRMNRDHTAARIESSFAMLREAGFDNINLDLMLSLPGETVREVRHSLAELKRLDPEHVSVYELVLEDKTVFKRQALRGKLPLPDEEEEIRQLTAVRDFLKAGGWRQYELLNYAKPGRESMHNRIYWRNEEYLGLGPGAFSYLDGKRYQYSGNFEEYIEKTRSSDWKNAEEEILSPPKKEIETFLLALRTAKGADAGRYADLAEKIHATAGKYAEKGLIEKKNGTIRLTDRGQFFAETIFSDFSSGES